MAPPAHAVSRRASGAPRTAAPAPRRAPLRIFEPAPRRRTRRRRGPNVLLVGGLVVGSLVAVVIADDVVAQGQIRLSTLQQEIATAATQHKSLQVAVAQLSAPPVVVTRAENQLGMVTPKQVVDLPEVPLDVALPVPVTAPAPGAPAPTTTSAPAPSTSGSKASTTPTPGGPGSASPSPTASTHP